MNELYEAEIALELRGLCKAFDRLDIIRGIDLQIHQGERVAIIGPNGAGKSTLFNLISGAVVPTAGDVVLNGQSIAGKKPHAINRMGLSRSFQVSSLFGKLSVAENLRCAMLWAAGYRYTFWRFLGRQKQLNSAVNDWLARLDLLDCRDELASNLSYARQRALELGMTLVGGASVVLLDEPTAGMSREETKHFVRLIRDVTQDKTLLMVEHDMDVVFEVADRIAVLVYGQVIAFDSPENVRSNPAVQQAYLGMPCESGLGV